MRNEFEVRSSEYPWNMAGWCQEKTEHLVSGLARIVDDIRHHNSADEDEKDSLYFHIYPVLYDATKMLSFSCGSKWSSDHPNLIYKEGYAGYEKVAVAYGLLDETTASKHENLRQSILHTLEVALDSPREMGRTRIHECVVSWRDGGSVMKRIGELIENVTMGEDNWDDFVIQTKPLLEELKSQATAM